MLSNYSIKKMIPRLVIAAILVNVSFYLAAAAVDVSNLLGYNLIRLFDSVSIAESGQLGGTSNLWTEVVSNILLIGVGVALIVLVIAAPAVLLALGLVVLILIARKALILLLVVIAPIAFVAWLLPNTEDWFKKWWKMFFALLMVFPIIALVFGASQLASDILIAAAQGETETGKTETDYMMLVAGLATAALPLFAIPSLLKGAIAAAGTIGGKLQGIADRTQGNAMNTAKKRASDAAGNVRKDIGSRWKIAANSDRGIVGGKLGGVTRWNTRRRKLREAREGAANRAETVRYSEEVANSERLQRKAAGGVFADDAAITRAAAQATQVGFKQFDEDVDAYKTTLTSMSNDDLVKKLASGEGSAEYQSAVAGTIMSRDHRDSHIAALRIMGGRAREAEAAGDKTAMKVITDVEKQMSHDMKDKPWALGDQAAGQLQNGTYGYSESHTGEKQEQLGDIDAEMKDRVLKKLSTQSLANMNPDELKAIYRMADNTQPGGAKLSEAAIANLTQKISDIRVSRYKDDIKPEAQVLFDEIQKQHGNPPPTSARPTAQSAAGQQSANTPVTQPQTQQTNQPPTQPQNNQGDSGTLDINHG